MSEYDFDEFFAYVTGKAPAIFNKDGRHETFVFVQQHDQGDWTGIPLPWRSPEEKESMYRQLAFVYRNKPANAYILVCEAWAVKRAIGNVTDGPVRDEPDRMEILTIYGASRTGARKTKIWLIEREGEAVSLKADNDFSGDTLEAALDKVLLHQPIANLELRDVRKNRN